MHVIIYALSKWGSLITTKSALRNVPPACCWKKGKIPTVLCAWYEPSVWDSANALFSAATQVEGEASQLCSGSSEFCWTGAALSEVVSGARGKRWHLLMVLLISAGRMLTRRPGEQ